jgi:hypothetical protein
MSLGSGPMSSKRWRPLEQVGWAVGIVAAGLVLLCIWAFALVRALIGRVAAPGPPKTGAGSFPWIVPIGAGDDPGTGVDEARKCREPPF